MSISTANLRSPSGSLLPWTTAAIQKHTQNSMTDSSLRAAERLIESSQRLPPCLDLEHLADEHGDAPVRLVVEAMANEARQKRQTLLLVQVLQNGPTDWVIMANDRRNGRQWLWSEGRELNTEVLHECLQAFTTHAGKDTLILPHGALAAYCRQLRAANGGYTLGEVAGAKLRLGLPAFRERALDLDTQHVPPAIPRQANRLTHLERLEAESIKIMHDVVAEADNPVMLYSIGKDSAVMLHLARKAFHPAPPPFPLLHVDTRWKFQAMYDFRDRMARESGMELLVHINPEGVEKNINPLDHGSALHTDIMKTQGLKQALDKYGFDVAFGGARRDEEKSRAKERIFSFRTAAHRWDPKSQRPELWNLYNSRKNKGESIRVFPLSNWTELDIWQYIYKEGIPIVPLYFAAERPVVERGGMLLMADDNRFKLLPGEEIQVKQVRFRTLGCYPLTGAVESNATDMAHIILELFEARTSERQGRAIDSDTAASMEKKKVEGYF